MLSDFEGVSLSIHHPGFGFLFFFPQKKKLFPGSRLNIKLYSHFSV